MNNYKAVRSGREISKRIADYLELADAANYQEGGTADGV